MIEWADGVNKEVKRNGASWKNVQGFITDTTRSGKVKRRLAHYMGSRQYAVVFHFTPDEYELFENWYENKIYYGAYSFRFPCIDSVTKDTYREYRIADGGTPSYTNTAGDIIECSMTWEEVSKESV